MHPRVYKIGKVAFVALVLLMVALSCSLFAPTQDESALPITPSVIPIEETDIVSDVIETATPVLSTKKLIPITSDNAGNLKPIFKINAPQRYLVSISPDGAHTLLLHEKTLEVWSIETQQLIYTFDAPLDECAHFFLDTGVTWIGTDFQKIIMSTCTAESSDLTVAIIDFQNPQNNIVIDNAYLLSVSPTGENLAYIIPSTNSGVTINIFNLLSGESKVLLNSPSSLPSGSFFPIMTSLQSHYYWAENEHLYLLGFYSDNDNRASFQYRNLETGEILGEIDGQDINTQLSTQIPDGDDFEYGPTFAGKILGVEETTGSVVVIDILSGLKVLEQSQLCPAASEGVFWSPMGGKVYGMCIWNVTTGKIVFQGDYNSQLRYHVHIIHTIDPSEQMMVIQNRDDGKIIIADINNGKELFSFPPNGYNFYWGSEYMLGISNGEEVIFLGIYE